MGKNGDFKGMTCYRGCRSTFLSRPLQSISLGAGAVGSGFLDQASTRVEGFFDPDIHGFGIQGFQVMVCPCRL